MQNIFTVALPLLASVTTNMATLPVFPPLTAPPTPFSVVKEFETTTAIREVAPEKPKEKRLICKGCSEHEQLALDYFQDQGIKDRNALATILGNIKQESMFVPNICEGGSRTQYHHKSAVSLYAYLSNNDTVIAQKYIHVFIVSTWHFYSGRYYASDC